MALKQSLREIETAGKSGAGGQEQEDEESSCIGLDHQNPGVVNTHLGRVIAGSQESLYFILRSLGLPAVGDPSTVPRIEVIADRQPALWAALQRLGIPHDDGRMVIEAERHGIQQKASRTGRSRSASQPRAVSMYSSTPSLGTLPALAPSQAAQSDSLPGPVNAAMQRLRCEHLARPKVRPKAAARCGYAGIDSSSNIGVTASYSANSRPPLGRAASQPQLEKSEEEELIARLSKPKWPPRRPPGAPTLLEEFLDDVNQGYFEVILDERRTQSADPEKQRKLCEQLARPKPKPPRYRERQARPRSAFDAARATLQRESMSRLSRPKSATVGNDGRAADESSLFDLRLDGYPEHDTDNGAWASQAEQLMRGMERQSSRDNLLTSDPAFRAGANVNSGQRLLDTMLRKSASERSATLRRRP